MDSQFNTAEELRGELATEREALATVRELRELDQKALSAKQRYIDEIRTTTYADLERALAAEREKCKQADVQLDRQDMVIRDLRSKLAAEREKVQTLVDALQMLYDHQNGCPLPKYEKDWNEAMRLSADALARHGELTAVEEGE